MPMSSHRLLCIDEGRQRLSLVDTADPAYGWSLDLAEMPLARALQRIGPERALVGFDGGFFELDIASGKVLRLVRRWRNVTAAFRLDGATLVTGHDLDGHGLVNVLKIGADDKVAGGAYVTGDYVRGMRPTPEGTWLLCMNDHILETDTALRPLRRFAAPGFEHAWMAMRQPDGTTLVSGGYGAFMARFDTTGRLTATFGGRGSVAEGVQPFFYASFQILPDGGVLVANWQGHGPDNGSKGRQLLEFDAGGALRASWSDPQRISSLQGILLL
jgi:hypothetical protein